MDAYCPIIVPMCCDICGLPRFVFAKTWRMLWGRCLDMEAGLSEYVTNRLLLVSGCRVEYPCNSLISCCPMLVVWTRWPVHSAFPKYPTFTCSDTAGAGSRRVVTSVSMLACQMLQCFRKVVCSAYRLCWLEDRPPLVLSRIEGGK